MHYFILNVEYGGLGDHLFFSPVPRLLKDKYGDDCRVYLSSQSNFRNWQTYEFVWSQNPYLDGLADPQSHNFKKLETDKKSRQVMESILRRYSLKVATEPEPEIYHKISKYDNSPGFIVDLNYSSYVGLLDSDIVNLALKLDEKFIFLNPNKLIRSIIPSQRYFYTNSLHEYASVIKSSNQFYCLTSGGATLARALNVAANVYATYNYPEYFTHRGNNYIFLGMGSKFIRRCLTYYLLKKNLKIREVSK